MRTFPKRITVGIRKKPTQYLKQLCDALVFVPEALRRLVDNVGSPGRAFTDGERIAILGGTAASLLGSA